MQTMKSKLSNSVVCALMCLTAVNMLASYLILQDRSPPPLTERQYSYIGEDFPEHWPLPPTDPVALVIEDPSRYPITHPSAREEWASSTPKGFGYIRLGPEHRSFSVSLFHEYHCLRVFRSGLAGNYNPTIVTHIGHCLVYLREMVMCDPDMTLEPHDALERDFEVQRAGATHVCKDWRQVYDAMSSNWEEWVRFRDATMGKNGTVVPPPSVIT